jgi:hypothetical protein
MENFFKKNWGKVAVVALVLIIGVYYVSSLSQTKNSNDTAFNNKENCASKAQAFLQHEKQIDSPENGINANVLNEQYTYNSALNTCLVYFEVAEIGSGTTYSIIDLLTNKKLYSYIEYRDQSMQKVWNDNCKIADGCFVNKNDFTAKFNELFK